MPGLCVWYKFYFFVMPMYFKEFSIFTNRIWKMLCQEVTVNWSQLKQIFSALHHQCQRRSHSLVILCDLGSKKLTKNPLKSFKQQKRLSFKDGLLSLDWTLDPLFWHSGVPPYCNFVTEKDCISRRNYCFDQERT